MKKFFVVTLLVLVTASGAFAHDMTIGAGGLYSINWFTDDFDGYYRNGFGAFAFFGASRFFEFNLGYINKKDDSERSGYQAHTLQIGLYLKYPFFLSEKVVIFPSIGIDFEYNGEDSQDFFVNWENYVVSGSWNEFWFRGGLGMDFFITERLFLRGHFIYGYAIPVGAKGDTDYYVFHAHGPMAKVGLGWMF